MTVWLRWCNVPYTRRWYWRCVGHAAAVKHAAKYRKFLNKNFKKRLKIRSTGDTYIWELNKEAFNNTYSNKRLVLSYLLTYSMEQSLSWDANRFSASQEIPRISWNPKVHYRIHTCSPPVPILSQLDLVHVLTPQFLKIHLNIILPSMPGSYKVVSFLQASPPKPCTWFSSPHTRYMPRPSHSFWFDYPNNIWWAVQIIKLLVMYFSPLPCYIVPLRPIYSPQHPISNTLSFCSSLNVSDQFSHPYKITCKILVLHIWIFKFLSGKLEDKRFCTKW